MDKITAKELDGVFSAIKVLRERDKDKMIHISFDSFKDLNLRFPVFVYVGELIKRNLLKKDVENSETPKGFYSIKLDGHVFEGFEVERRKECREKWWSRIAKGITFSAFIVLIVNNVDIKRLQEKGLKEPPQTLSLEEKIQHRCSLSVLDSLSNSTMTKIGK